MALLAAIDPITEELSYSGLHWIPIPALVSYRWGVTPTTCEL
jgi:hypothetical protein